MRRDMADFVGMQQFIGNVRLVGWLRRAVAADQVSHAYLLTGPEQIGKRTLALAFAQLIQCDDRPPGGDVACGACVACRKIMHANHPDVQVLALPKDRQQYSIDQVRDIIKIVTLKPTEGRKRIFIVPNVDMMSLPGLQASLKVLEEPPPSAMILLTCVNADLLLPTIISRCQQVALQPVAPEELAQALQTDAAVEPQAALELALLAGGRPGWAIDALGDPAALAERRQMLRDLAALARASRAERITAAGKYASDKDTAQRTIELWLPWWRDVALAAHGAGSLIRHTDDQQLIEALARSSGPQAAERFVRAQIQALTELEQNANPRLVFEVLLQSLPGA